VCSDDAAQAGWVNYVVKAHATTALKELDDRRIQRGQRRCQKHGAA